MPSMHLARAFTHTLLKLETLPSSPSSAAVLSQTWFDAAFFLTISTFYTPISRAQKRRNCRCPASGGTVACCGGRSPGAPLSLPFTALSVSRRPVGRDPSRPTVRRVLPGPDGRADQLTAHSQPLSALPPPSGPVPRSDPAPGSDHHTPIKH